MNNEWHWRWGKGQNREGINVQKVGAWHWGWFVYLFVCFAVVYWLVVSRSKVMTLDMDEWVWVEKIGEKIEELRRQGMMRATAFHKMLPGQSNTLGNSVPNWNSHHRHTTGSSLLMSFSALKSVLGALARSWGSGISSTYAVVLRARCFLTPSLPRQRCRGKLPRGSPQDLSIKEII